MAVVQVRATELLQDLIGRRDETNRHETTKKQPQTNWARKSTRTHPKKWKTFCDIASFGLAPSWYGWDLSRWLFGYITHNKASPRSWRCCSSENGISELCFSDEFISPFKSGVSDLFTRTASIISQGRLSCKVGSDCAEHSVTRLLARTEKWKG